MKVTTLIEDTKQDNGLTNELGLSLFIESNGINILDTVQGEKHTAFYVMN